MRSQKIPNGFYTSTGNVDPDDDIIGTDILNGFGQFFDFQDNRLTLIGPSDPYIRHLVGNGIVFNVDQATQGLARTAVEQEVLFGSIPQLQGNANAGTGANTLIGPTAPPEAASTVFRTHLTGSNASYIDEAAIGVQRGVDVINAQSLGADGIDRDIKLFFGVDEASQGQPGSDVNDQKGRNQHKSDIFDIPFGQATPKRIPGSNSLTINQEVIGLGANVGPGAVAPNSPDNLLGFDLLTQLALPANSLSNLDSPIVSKNDSGTAARPRVGDERLAQNFDSYFSLLGSQDIFRSDVTDIFADGFLDIGLSFLNLDDIDALALFRPSVGPGRRGQNALARGPLLSPNLIINPANGGFTFDPNDDADFLGIDAFISGVMTDLALFSLTPDSATLQALGLSAADIFITDFDGTFTLFASAESLGLRFEDNVDGLDSIAVDEPRSLLGTLFVTLVSLSVIRRRSKLDEQA